MDSITGVFVSVDITLNQKFIGLDEKLMACSNGIDIDALLLMKLCSKKVYKSTRRGKKYAQLIEGLSYLISTTVRFELSDACREVNNDRRKCKR